MIYETADDWRNAPNKHILLFGMSGLGKTYVSNLLRDQGEWFHYSVDYRIGTRYMGEYIADNAKAEAMKVPFLRELLMSDSIYIGSNITFENLSPVASYLGKPGDPNKGGVPIDEYRRRQDQFRRAEIDALMDTSYFIRRAQSLYGYPNFICDTGGSICEWVDPEDANDPIMTTLSKECLCVWIEGSDAHIDELCRRFDKAPKPMSYQPEFLTKAWADYLAEKSVSPDDVNPDDFIRWTYRKALDHRQPRYRAMANRWGITVKAEDIYAVRSAEDFQELIARTLEARA
ncbi:MULTISPECIES: ATPase [unclassified Marivivens]|uniref:ATPase n=1 Tax=unclassified Marivivens TaxID=2622455 RepID=UPI0007FDFE09|nr:MULTISPECIES: ATPase [unclassified Marivivens]APO86736.1 ATPase [Marivivens sp. JLT3646]NVJ96222.1 ATPase [Marivivens sp.]OBR39466.1 ATPase [Donghicola sp. JL3646]